MKTIDSWKYRMFDVFVLFIIALIPLLWFPSGYMVTGQDAAYPINIIENFKSRLFTWNGQEPFGRDYSYDMGSVTIHGIESGMMLLGTSLFDAQKFTFIFWFFMMGISMYYCAYSFRKHFPYRYFPLFAAILYSVNFYLLALWRQGAGTTFSAYTALPLIASLYIRALSGELSVVKAGLLISLALFFFNAGGGLSIPLFGGLLIVITTATVYFPIIQSRQDGIFRMIRRVSGLIVLCLLLSLILHAYWIMPFLSFAFINYHSSVATQVVLSGARSWMDSVSGYTSISNLLRLQGFPDWYNNASHSYSTAFLYNPVLVIISFLFPLAAYYSLIIVKEFNQKKLIVFLVVVSLLGLFFSAGTHKPTGHLMGLMVDYIPGFSIFRSAQYKFVSSLYFSFALLISYTLNFTIERMKDRKIRFIRYTGIVKQFLLIGFMGVVLLYHYPFFTPDFFVWAKPLTLMLKIPDYAMAFKSWSDANLNYDERLFILPRLNTVWNVEVYTWNSFSPYSMINLITDKPTVENVAALSQTEPALVDRMYQEILNGNTALIEKLAALLQTQYILYRGDANFTLDWIPAENPEVFLNALRRIPSAQQVWSQGEWSVYRIPQDRKFAGRIFGLESATVFSGSDKDSIGALIAGSNNFVRDADMQSAYLSDVIGRLPIKGVIAASPCFSCGMEREISQLNKTDVRFLPGSFFYFIKTWKERNLESPSLGSRELLGNMLGLSMIRTQEIKKLIEADKDIQFIAQIGTTLTRYWNTIGESLDLTDSTKLIDFGYLETLRNYLAYEESIIIDLYNNDSFSSSSHRPLVHEELAKILQSIQPVSERVNQFISGIDWSSVKYFDVPQGSSISQIYLDMAALGSPPRLPIAVRIGNRTHNTKPTVSGNKAVLGTFDLSGSAYVTLIFPQAPNVLGEFRSVNDHYPTWRQQCVTADIRGFLWQKKYKLSLTEAGSIKGMQVFIRKINAAHARSDKSLSGYTVPNYSLDLDEQKDKSIKTFYVNGSDGDTGAALYVCSSLSADSALLGKQITVEELIEPSVYFVPAARNLIDSPIDTLTYERINSTKYIIHSSGGVWPKIVVFNERFNPGWRLYDYSQSHRQAKPWTKEFWVDDPAFNPHHFRIYGFANAWYIDRVPEGDLLLEYYPQVLYYRGIVISIVGFTMVIVAGVIILLKQKTKRI